MRRGMPESLSESWTRKATLKPMNVSQNDSLQSASDIARPVIFGYQYRAAKIAFTDPATGNVTLLAVEPRAAACRRDGTDPGSHLGMVASAQLGAIGLETGPALDAKPRVIRVDRDGPDR
jgi:hypothetical protein